MEPHTQDSSATRDSGPSRRGRRRRPGLQDLTQDVRFALRNVGRSPAMALVAVVTLALGIGANTAIFSVLHAVLLEPLPYEAPDRLVQIWESALHLDIPKSNTSYPNFSDLRSRSTELEAMAAVGGERQTLTGLGEPRRLLVALVSEDFFDVARRPPLLGRTLAPEDYEGGGTAVLGYALWNRVFGGDREVVGRVLELDGAPVTVVGVMPPGFDFPYGELWRPLIVPPGEGRGHRYLDVYGRLKPGVGPATAQAELDGVLHSLEESFPDTLTGAGVVVEPLRDALVGEVRPILVLLFAAVGLLLVIACANVAHLTLARTAARRRELAVRASLGASRGRLLRQLVSESLVLALAGGLAGLVVAQWTLGFFTSLLPGTLPRLDEIRLDGTVLAFTWALTLVCGLVFGLAPGLQVTRANLSDALRAGAKALGGAAPSGRLRRSLVVLETALALVLVAGAGLLARSLVSVLEVDPGFRTENVVATQLVLPPSSYPEARQQAAFFESLVEEVEALPQVISAGVIQRPPLRRGFNTSFTIPGRPKPPPNHESLANIRLVSAGYFRTLGIELRAGRAFEAGDTAEAPPVMVVNETFARRNFPGEDPVGRYVEDGWREVESQVVGVVADVKMNGLEEDAPPVMYVPHTQMPFATMTLAVRTAAPLAAMAPALKERVWSLDPRLAVDEVFTLESRLAASTARRRFTLLLLAAFAGVALVMASVGLYGVIGELVAARTRELGLRMALGATARDVMRLVLARGMSMAAAGIGLGLAAALALGRWITGLLFGVGAVDPATFLAVTAILAAVAFAACWVPARRAALVDPVRALQWE